MVEKIDLKKQYKKLYTPSAKNAEIVTVPALNFAMLDGIVPAGTPPAESKAFQDSMAATYGVVYTLKFSSKLRKQDPIDFSVMALEGLWWTASNEAFDFQKRQDWYFTLMIILPDFIGAAMFEEAVEQLKKKKDNPAIDQLRLERFEEGPSVQIMHVGPYSREPESLARMYQYASEAGYRLRGKHHEIYLGDPRRADPEKLKTILRHPVESA
jgi:hypothetical protein